MSGGGVTPFSPTPWLFDTGESPASMGQNCVVGTTELDEDEDNGIGLVLYVLNGNNIIVWDMQTGERTGQTIPVSGDFQNRLKAAYEAKTGESIGYVILHPTTDESINIDDFVVINDTPEEALTAVWYPITGGGYFIPGTIIETSGSKIFEVDVKNDKIFVTDANGVIENDSAVAYTNNLENYLPTLFQKYGVQIDGTRAVEKEWSVGDNIPEWDNYTKFQS